MINYETVLKRLFAMQDENYRRFHKRLLCNETINVIGVRMPLLRKLAKEWKGMHDVFLTFPDEFYEVTLLKCLLVGALPFEEFCKRVDGLVALLDNWATCDCFLAPSIGKNREAFLPYVDRYLKSGEEFVVRYALVTLMRYYLDDTYLPFALSAAESCDCSKYYIHMAAAWLIAEVLVKNFDCGVEFLKQTRLDPSTKNKAIQKARESYRLTSDQKQSLLCYKEEKKSKRVDKSPKVG